MFFRVTLLASVAVLPATQAQTQSQQQLQFEWRVKDRFRLFDQANISAKAKANQLLDKIGRSKNSALHSFYLDFLNNLSGIDGASSHSASFRTSNYRPAGPKWPRTSGRYQREYLYPDTYSIEVRATANPDGSAYVCRYASKFDVREGKCNEWVSLKIAGGKATSQAQWRVNTTIELSVNGHPQGSLNVSFSDRLVVALGDSFISGEGNPDVPSVISNRASKLFSKASWGRDAKLGVDVLSAAKWWDEPCHRSLLSWPVLASVTEAARNPHQAVTLVHLGCSGAVAADIYRHGEADLPGGGDENESQLSQLSQLMTPPDEEWESRKIDSMLLSVGGNDIGFVGVLSTLMMPPNGFTLGPLVAREVGKTSRAVCPYNVMSKPLSRLCETELSAQSRLETLATEYEKLRNALKNSATISRILQTQYPNPLIGRELQACDNNPENDKKKDPINPLHNLIDSTNPKKDVAFNGGFEALMGLIPKKYAGGKYSWGYEIQYYAESFNKENKGGKRLFNDDYKLDCDDQTEPGDSEVCQALWVHKKLNDKVSLQRNPDIDWLVVSTHVDQIMKHGLCVGDSEYPLQMPRSEIAGKQKQKHWSWVGDVSPSGFRPYHETETRWFRTTNDSILTQFSFFNGEPRFHHGTAHPTYRSHIEYADAILNVGLWKDPG
jgi:hypothetical protein